MDNIKEDIVPPDIYTRDYYLTDNEGCHEYAAGLDTHVHDKFKRALRLAQIQPGENVLDVGCGRGELVYYAVRQGAEHALGIDYSKAAVEIARETIQRLPAEDRAKAEAHVGAAESFPYKKKYDVIFFLEIAEHMYDWQLEAAFNKFNEILTANGRIICITPNYDFETKLLPMKLWLNIPGNLFKWPLRILRGKYKPKNFKELLSKIFRVHVDRGERNRQMHCNVLTPNRFRSHLKQFDTLIYCEDHSYNPLSLLLRHWWGRDIVAIARKKK